MASKLRTVGRPRDASLDAALLVATQDLLLEQGFDRMSVEAVAARASVGKAAIYRRWPGKTALVVAAVADLAHVPALPDTGTLRGDLIAAGETVLQNDRTQRVLAGLMTAMVYHPEVREAAREALGDPLTGLFREILRRATDSGALDRAIDVDTMASLFPALAFHRRASLGLTIDAAFIEQAVDKVLLPLLTATSSRGVNRAPDVLVDLEGPAILD